MTAPSPIVTRGRGAPLNAVSARFDDAARESDGDWLDARADVDGEPPRLRTTVTIERPKSIISRNQSPDVPFDRSINAYRGCEHGCVYCFARPSHAYHNLSPGLDFETRLFAKPDAARLLANEFAKPSYDCAVLALGTNTDPYQPIEATHRITRALLEVLRDHRHPVTITTKSDRCVRDLDILAPMAADGLAVVMISVTTLDRDLARTLEPRAATPARRLAAIRTLSAAGVPAFVSASPIIPGLNDHEVEAIIAVAAEHGATGAFCQPVRLPHEVAPLFDAWLDAHRPLAKDKVLTLIRDMRGGKLNDPRFGDRMRGAGPYWAAIRARFALACRRHGLKRETIQLRTDLFRRPAGPQGCLF